MKANLFLQKVHNGFADRLLTFLFYLAWTVELVIVIIDKSALINPYESYLFRATFAVFALIMIFNADRYSKREWILLVAMLVLTLADYRISGRNVLLRCVVMMAACRQIYPRKVMKYTLFLTTAGCLVLVILSLTGILGTVSITQDYGSGPEKRYTLGLGHPNSLHCMACMLTLLALYLYGQQKNKRRALFFYVGLSVFQVGLYMLTKSNTGFLVSAAGIVLTAIMYCLDQDNWQKRQKRIACWYYLGEAVLAAGLVYSVLGAIINPVGNPFWTRLDRLMTGRVASLWDTTFHEGTLSTWCWFGSRQNTAYFDMGFVRFIYWFGVIPAIVLVILIYALLRKMRRSNDAAAFIMLLMSCIYTIPEAHLVSVYLGRNYCLLLAAEYCSFSRTVKREGSTINAIADEGSSGVDRTKLINIT